MNNPVPEPEFKIADNVEKLFVMALWKMMGQKTIIVTGPDLERFKAEFKIDEGQEPKLIIRGSEDGIMFQVLTQDKAKDYIAEYTAAGKGILAHDSDAKGS